MCLILYLTGDLSMWPSGREDIRYGEALLQTRYTLYAGNGNGAK